MTSLVNACEIPQKACSGAVKCQEQDEASTKKRERIGEHELAVAKKFVVR